MSRKSQAEIAAILCDKIHQMQHKPTEYQFIELRNAIWQIMDYKFGVSYEAGEELEKLLCCLCDYIEGMARQWDMPVIKGLIKKIGKMTGRELERGGCWMIWEDAKEKLA